MRFGGWLGAARRIQRLDHALAHFSRRLARESDGGDFFGRLNPAQQQQITLNEQFRFARTGGRLNDKGVPGIECAQALLEIGDVTHHRLPLSRYLALGHPWPAARFR